MSTPNRITRPGQTLHGGGGANTPGDRETRYVAGNAERENRN